VSVPLALSRSQILAYRRTAQGLEERLGPGPDSLRGAAGVGLQDSVPRSALHSLHARVERIAADAWEDPALVQVWGPRYTAYVVPAGEHAPFTLARLPATGRLRERAEGLAARLAEHLDGRKALVDDAGSALGVHPNSLRYAALTGTVLIRWNGARQPTVWTVPRPEMDAAEALQELLRRYLQAYGPATVDAFVRWGGVDGPAANAAFDALDELLLAVRTPVGGGRILAADEPALRAPAHTSGAARLLPSGDPYYLLWGVDRELVVPDAARRAALWTSRVWPGAVLVAGEIIGTWRRAKAVVAVTPWRRLTDAERTAVETEVSTLPLPDVVAPAVVRWEDA